MTYRYTQEQRAQILNEVREARNVPASTIHTWLSKLRGTTNKMKTNNDQSIVVENKQLKNQLSEKDTEIQILRDLLKKTYVVWNKD